ncbi:carbohydrate sulfotransferase [Elysia marginata]|uniref:Carbohydrate sulfotransferase n=1 Tax=Elysia marginata TaxID=1093978 RepID=A0AAV4EUE0_9GAST|nr:carbohydrate sulfotransferase [Elysia marginata]
MLMFPPCRPSKLVRAFILGVLTALLLITAVQFVRIISEVITGTGNYTQKKAAESHLDRLQHEVDNLNKAVKNLPRFEGQENSDSSRLYHPSPSGQSVDPDEVFKRARHVHNVCLKREKQLAGLTNSTYAYERISIDKKRKHLFCPIYKVSSTFLRRVLYSLETYGELKNPYSIPIEKALKAKTDSLMGLLSLDERQANEFLSEANSFLIVREPLVRLLSGYMDKLFAPNPFYWNKTGTYIVSKYRSKPNHLETVCGHNVTFNEFARYIVDGELDPKAVDYRDPHFTPAYDQCKVCRLNYGMVGKMESFTTDMYTILNNLIINVTKDQLVEWKEDVVKDAIIDSVESPFLWRPKVRMCMSWHSSLRRVWRKLQSRAIIPLEEKFPFSEFQSERVTAQDFITTAHFTHLRADKSRLKRQKKEVLAMAYKTVDRSLLPKLLEVMEPDFTLFKYNIHPDFLFDNDFLVEVDKLPNIFDVRTL